MPFALAMQCCRFDGMHVSLAPKAELWMVRSDTDFIGHRLAPCAESVGHVAMRKEAVTFMARQAKFSFIMITQDTQC